MVLEHRLLHGIISLPFPLFVTTETFGKTFTATLPAGLIELMFPVVVQHPSEKQALRLGPPIHIDPQYRDWAKGNRTAPADDTWGGGSYSLELEEDEGDPKDDSKFRKEVLKAVTVSAVAFQTKVVAEDGESVFDLIPRIGAQFDQLFTLTLSWLELAAGVLIPRSSVRLSSRSHVIDRSTEPPKLSGWGLGFDFSLNQPRISAAMMKGSLDRASLNERPPVEWALFLDALRQNDTRRTVIDACTAAEIAMSGFIRRNLQEVSEAAVDRIINNAGGVAGLIRLAELMEPPESGSSLRGKVINLLAGVRNDAAHSGIGPDAERTTAALATSRAVLIRYSPLPLVPFRLNR